MNTMYNKSSHI